jgi:hypothetical protein
VVIPANQATQVLQALMGATQELEKRLREQAEQPGAGKTTKGGRLSIISRSLATTPCDRTSMIYGSGRFLRNGSGFDRPLP